MTTETLIDAVAASVASPGLGVLSSSPSTSSDALPFRRSIMVTEAVIAIAGAAGAVQLWDGRTAPPLSDIEPLGLKSWRLPAVWLTATVAVPSAVAAVAAARRNPATPKFVVAAAGLLLLEVTSQIPFVGPSPLQGVFGAVAVGTGVLGCRARRSGAWRPR